MKLTLQSIPPEYAASYEKLVSTDATGAGAGEYARTRRAARRAPRRRLTTWATDRLTQAVENLAQRLHYEPGTPAFSQFVYDELQALRTGTINPDYWLVLPLLESRTYQTTPTSSPDPDPPPYSYRIASNLPTIPEYGAPVLSSGNPSAQGQVIGNYWNDGPLKWACAIYSLFAAPPTYHDLPLLITSKPTIDVDATSRASRPMLSLLFRTRLESYLTADPWPTLPITDGAISAYWRYRIPASVAPFYHAETPRRVISPLLDQVIDAATADDTRLIIEVSPRPMFGYGNNNNTSVAQTITPNLEPVQLNPCAGEPSAPLGVTIAGAMQTLDIATGTPIAFGTAVTTSQCAYGPAWGLERTIDDKLYMLNADYQRTGPNLITAPESLSFFNPFIHPLGVACMINTGAPLYQNKIRIWSPAGQPLITSAAYSVSSWQRFSAGPGPGFVLKADLYNYVYPILHVHLTTGQRYTYGIHSGMDDHVIPTRGGIFIRDSTNRVWLAPWPAYPTNQTDTLDPTEWRASWTHIANCPAWFARRTAVPGGAYVCPLGEQARFIDYAGNVTLLPNPPSGWTMFPYSTCQF